MIVGDVAHSGDLAEDWWIAPEFFDQQTIDTFMLAETYNADQAVYLDPVSAHFKPRNR